MEYSVEHSIKGIYGTMPTKVFDSTWGRTRCKVQWLSEELPIDEFPSRLAIKIMSQELLTELVKSPAFMKESQIMETCEAHAH